MGLSDFLLGKITSGAKSSSEKLSKLRLVFVCVCVCVCVFKILPALGHGGARAL